MGHFSVKISAIPGQVSVEINNPLFTCAGASCPGQMEVERCAERS